MNKETFERMFDLLTAKPEDKKLEDMTFVRNNLEGFSQAMLKIATMELVRVDGVDKDKVDAILLPLVDVFKMVGANDYADFVEVADMFKEEGLA